MDRKSVAGLLALGMVLGGAAGGAAGGGSAEAAFLPYVPYSGAAISDYNGPTPYDGLAITDFSNGTMSYTLGDFSGLEFEWINPNATSSVCTSRFGCEYGSELDSSKDYLVYIFNTKGVSGTVITLTAGDDPFKFAYRVASAPLPSSAPMFGAALLGLGALAWRKRLKAATPCRSSSASAPKRQAPSPSA